MKPPGPSRLRLDLPSDWIPARARVLLSRPPGRARASSRGQPCSLGCSAGAGRKYRHPGGRRRARPSRRPCKRSSDGVPAHRQDAVLRAVDDAGAAHPGRLAEAAVLTDESALGGLRSGKWGCRFSPSSPRPAARPPSAAATPAPGRRLPAASPAHPGLPAVLHRRPGLLNGTLRRRALEGTARHHRDVGRQNARRRRPRPARPRSGRAAATPARSGRPVPRVTITSGTHCGRRPRRRAGR